MSECNELYISVRSIAKLCGISPSELLDKRENRPGLLLRLKEGIDLPPALRNYAGFDYWKDTLVPLKLAEAIIYYYAFEDAKDCPKAVTSYVSLVSGNKWMDIITKKENR